MTSPQVTATSLAWDDATRFLHLVANRGFVGTVEAQRALDVPKERWHQLRNILNDACPYVGIVVEYSDSRRGWFHVHTSADVGVVGAAVLAREIADLRGAQKRLGPVLDLNPSVRDQIRGRLMQLEGIQIQFDA